MAGHGKPIITGAKPESDRILLKNAHIGDPPHFLFVVVVVAVSKF